LWPINIHDRLPVIPIPLKDPDENVVVDLQAVFERVYDGAYYEDDIYTFAPQPPLTPEQQARAAELMARTSA